MKIEITNKDYLIKNIRAFGNGSCVLVPKSWIGDEVVIISLSDENISLKDDLIIAEANEVQQKKVTKQGNTGMVIVPSWWTSRVLVVKE